MRILHARAWFSYVCDAEKGCWAEAICQSLSGRALDAEIERQVLEVLKPAGLEVSLAVAADLEARRAKEETLWKQRLERARYEAERAQRQYDIVEPENRLVVRTLERQWEEKLQAVRQLEEEYHRHQAACPPTLSSRERDAIRKLAEDIPGLWHSATTTWTQRKEIVRQLIDKIHVTVVDKSERVQVSIVWAGGHETRIEIRRPVGRTEQLTYYPSLVERIGVLRKEGRTSEDIAKQLNQEHWQTAQPGKPISADTVRQIWHRQGRPKFGLKPNDGQQALSQEGEA